MQHAIHPFTGLGTFFSSYEAVIGIALVCLVAVSFMCRFFIALCSETTRRTVFYQLERKDADEFPALDTKGDESRRNAA